MIHVKKQQEPIDFNIKVRIPGRKFLNSCPQPKRKDWHRHNYWRECNRDLYDCYNGVCAYTGEWFSLTTGVVDHFKPKSLAPGLAYEWDNYRLATQRANHNKDSYIIVDPFNVQLGWFTLEIPSCLIVVGDGLSCEIYAQVKYTIEKLRLNSDDEYVQRRCDTIIDYINGNISFASLRRYFPFIASELERQGIDSVEKIGGYFKSWK